MKDADLSIGLLELFPRHLTDLGRSGSVALVVVRLRYSGGTLAEAEKAMAAELAHLAHDGPTDEELTRTRNNLEFMQVKRLENRYDVALTAQLIGTGMGDLGKGNLRVKQ